jgi:6-phosphofructokinase 1
LGTDKSGNPILADVGPWLRDQLKAGIRGADVKYIDPSYIIRSVPCISNDRIYCKILAHNAVHSAFAGYTGVTVGLVNTHYVLLPIPVVISAPRRVSHLHPAPCVPKRCLSVSCGATCKVQSA